MATSRVTIRTLDYHKFRSLLVDRDVPAELRDRCDRDLATLCDAVRLVYDRRRRFHDDCDDDDGGDGGDLARLGEICGRYKLILENRRVRPVDVRLCSGWWQVRALPRDEPPSNRQVSLDSLLCHRNVVEYVVRVTVKLAHTRLPSVGFRR